MVQQDDGWLKLGFELATACLTLLWGGIVVLYWKLWDTLATREWVKEEIQQERESDSHRDRQLIADLLAPMQMEVGVIKGEIAAYHVENRETLEQILKLLRARKR